MDELKKNIISMYGDNGKQWLDSLPEITAKIAITCGDGNPIVTTTFYVILASK